MAGILRVIVRFRSSSGVSQREIKQSKRLYRTLSNNRKHNLQTKSQAYFSSQFEFSLKATMSEKKKPVYTLPVNVVPQHYEITLKPDLTNFKFDGKENIHVKVNESTDTILLNASELNVSNISFKGDDGKELQPETYDLHQDTKTLVIKFAEKLVAGKTGQLSMQFEGPLDDSMRGFYRCKYTSPEGETKYSAVTQFEAIDARKCFPCWDEPAHKATFDMTLIVPKHLTALSNMPVKEESAEGDLLCLKFDTTPKMSTYLLAVAVGEFDYVESKSDSGVQVRIYTPKGKSNQGKFALDVAVKSLSYYDSHFGIPYPLPKLDCIAVPDFLSGAMENWGLVTFRESCILFDEENTSSANKQWIGLVISHEIAHQWFGNLVTMSWWTDLWLNEGYATFTEFVCMGELYPEFDTWQQFVIDERSKAMELDALKNSHPIEVPIEDPDAVDEIFDDISYSKGASVIRMMYAFLGRDCFMKGLNSYLKTYSYANAKTDDLWQSLESASDKPVCLVMPTWTRQTGYPLLSVEQEQRANERLLVFSQQRFTADGSADPNQTQWMIPVTIVSSSSAEPLSILITEKQSTISLPNTPADAWVKINPDAIGVYRTKYSHEMLYALLPSIKDKSLPALDRFSYLDDLFNIAKAGYGSTEDVLKVLQAYKQEDSYIVWVSIASCISKIARLIYHLPFYDQFQVFSRNLFHDIYNKVGWDAKPGESHLDALLRSLILGRMAMLQDPHAIAEARQRFQQHVSGNKLIPADLRSSVYRAVANNADDQTFDTMLQLFKKSELHEEKDRILSALGVVRPKHLLTKLLDLSVSEEVRAQDTMYVFQSTSWSAQSRDHVWQYVKDNWSTFNTKLSPILLTRIIKWTTEDFVTEDRATEVEQFLEQNPHPIWDRPTKQSIEKIRMNAEWLQRDSQVIHKFLHSQ